MKYGLVLIEVYGDLGLLIPSYVAAGRIHLGKAESGVDPK
jgi:hypothetical protein